MNRTVQVFLLSGRKSHERFLTVGGLFLWYSLSSRQRPATRDPFLFVYPASFRNIKVALRLLGPRPNKRSLPHF